MEYNCLNYFFMVFQILISVALNLLWTKGNKEYFWMVLCLILFYLNWCTSGFKSWTIAISNIYQWLYPSFYFFLYETLCKWHLTTASDKNIDKHFLQINSELINIYDWLCANKLTLNIKKTEISYLPTTSQNKLQLTSSIYISWSMPCTRHKSEIFWYLYRCSLILAWSYNIYLW